MVTRPVVDEAMRTLVRLAVEEDVGPEGVAGDKTVMLAIPRELEGKGVIVARRPGIVAGTFLIPVILEEYVRQGGRPVRCDIAAADGNPVKTDQAIATLNGSLATILTAERVVLNFLGRLSGVATLTRKYVDVVRAACTDAKVPAICDIRKTTPGFRVLEKFAVRCGGGMNHRMGLYDGVMLKDNHLAALREGHENLAALTAKVRAKLDPAITLWLEVDTLEQFREALGGPGGRSGADIILIDNFSPGQMREAVQLRDAARSKILLEASGGITLENLAEIARTGVDRISIGALTHSAAALDFSMEFPS